MRNLFLMLLVCLGAQAEDDFFKRKERGWHWYEIFPKKKEPQNPEGKTTSASEILSKYRKRLENHLARAILNPTSQNVLTYQKAQKEMLDRSQKFSETWMREVFENPRLDHTLKVPVNAKARHLYLDAQKRQVAQTIRGLSETYGLFFFFSGNCPYCHAFAPIVQKFSEEHGWEVLAISMEGGEVKEFPKAVPDNGLAQKWNVEALPPLFLR